MLKLSPWRISFGATVVALSGTLATTSATAARWQKPTAAARRIMPDYLLVADVSDACSGNAWQKITAAPECQAAAAMSGSGDLTTLSVFH